MTKKKLLKALNTSILQHDTITQEIYEDYVPKIMTLLYIIPEDTEIKGRDGVVPSSIAEFPANFDEYCRTRSTSEEGIQALNRYFGKLYAQLEMWVDSFRSDLLKICAVRYGKYHRHKGRRITFLVILSLIGVAALVSTALAIWEVFGVNQRIGAIIGAVGFSVDVIAFVWERVADMVNAATMEREVAKALNNGEKGVEEFERNYSERKPRVSIKKQINKNVHGDIVNGIKSGQSLEPKQKDGKDERTEFKIEIGEQINDSIDGDIVNGIKITDKKSACN